MNKKINTILSLTFIFSFCSCNNNTSSSTISSSNISNSSSSNSLIISNTSSSSNNNSTNEAPKNEVEQIFYELAKNNFTIDFTDCFYDLNYQTRNEKFYYTNYSLQAEGDFGFSGIAQGNELIFKYTLEDGEVVSGAPLINNINGVRYESLFEYSYGMNNFNYRDMSIEKDNDGYYIYKFGHNLINDSIIMSLFLRESTTSFPPEELKFKIIKDVITFKAIILSYDFNGDGINEGQDTITSIVYDIGKTENPEIKKYLSDGKTCKNPLDLRFYKLFHPYFFSNNYTVDLDGTEVNPNFKFTEYCTENAVYDYSDTINSGYMLNQGVVTDFNIVDDKIKINSTPMKDESSYYTSIYGEVLAYTFSDLDYNSLIGYKDDQNSNVYYLTDSYLNFILSYICYNERYDENYFDNIKVEIIDDDTHEMKLTFEMYNRLTNRNLGVVEARFYNLNKTSIPAVDEYLSLGDDPNTQTKENLENVLNKFKNHNYSMDFNTGSGLAKYYYTENYMYAEIYGNPNANFGFIKVDEAIYEFLIENGEVKLDKSIDYASGDNPHTLPGLAPIFGQYDDFGFISSISETLYDSNNYTISNIYDQNIWAITDVQLATNIFNYYFAQPKDILPTGVGVVVKDAELDSKLSIYLAYITSDGEYTGYSYLTYYDIGNTSYSLLDDYLKNYTGGE